MSKYRFEQIAFSSTEKKKPTEEDKYTYLGLEHLDPGSLQVARYGSDVAPIGEKLVMRKGDVLFGKRRAYQKKVAIAPFDGIFSAHGMVLRPKEDVIDKDFFPLFISSDYFLDSAIKISVGSLSPTINWSDLKELEFDLPDMDKQRKLAKVLWAMDATKKSYQKLLQKTDELVKSQFMQVFGDLDKTNGKYRYVELAQLCKKESSSISLKSVDGITGKYPLYGAAGLMQYIDFCEMDKAYVGIVKDGAGVGRVNAYPANSSILNTMQYITPTNGTLLTYLEYLLRYMNLAQGNSGSTIPHIYFKDYSKRIVPNPPIERQEQFAVFVHQSDKSKIELEQALVELTATYKKIFSENLG